MSSSRRSGSVNSTACSTVTPGISPTVSTCASRPSNTSRCISWRNSWMRGPHRKCSLPGPVARARPGRRVRQRRVLADHVDDVHAEAVDPAVEPPAHHRVDRLPDLRVLPVQVWLAPGEQVQVVLLRRLVPLPGRAREVRLPVGRLGARRARLGARPGVAPPVPVALRAVAARPRLHEPRVLVRGVVDDEVHHEPHAALVQRGDQLVEVGEGAEQRVDVLVVADVVAVVVHRRPVDRREPHHVDAELLQVVQAGQHAAQVAHAVPVGVGEAARVDLVARPSAASPRSAASRWCVPLPSPHTPAARPRGDRAAGGQG